MPIGLRPVSDARQRSFAHPQVQAAWAVLDCGFAQVADVFEECAYEALSRFGRAQLAAYLEAARWLGKLGRGAEPVLVFLQEWPAVVEALADKDSGDALAPVLDVVRAMQKSPNGGAIAGFLQTLAPVAGRLQSLAQLRLYLAVVLDLMQRTSGSIHGRHITFPSPGLPHFCRQAPVLLGLLSLGGLRNWTDYGIRNHGNHPERQAEYFDLRSADSRAILQRERQGTLFLDVERRLDLFLRALWRDGDPLVPYSTAFEDGGDGRPLLPYYDPQGLRVPDVLDDRAGISGLDRYRATLAHMAGHRRWSRPQIADNWSPFQRLAVETFEDCRIDVLLAREYPGLGRLFRALHPVPVEGACDDTVFSCLRHRLAMLSRALLDPAHHYGDANLREAEARFRVRLLAGESGTAEMAELALAYVTRTRRQSDQLANVHFADTVVDYRDDNRHLWRFIEQGDEEEAFAEPRALEPGEEAAGLPPRRYPEWDSPTQTYRPDWASVYESLHPAGDAADIDRLLARHAALAKRLKRLLDIVKPQDRVRQRFQEDGSDLDLDVALRAVVDMRGGAMPDPRIQFSHRTDGRNIAVQVLLDLSESLNQPAGDGRTVLELEREAVALLAWAIDCLGDPCAIAGFHSNTRHDVRFLHLKGFGEGWGEPVKARLAAMQAGWSTRMGAALRHAGHTLARRRADKRILLLLTDGEPADVDVDDPQHLRADARRAVEELETRGIVTYCLSLDPKADTYVSEIFGRRWRVLDRIERLPEQLPMIYLGLTR